MCALDCRGSLHRGFDVCGILRSDHGGAPWPRLECPRLSRSRFLRSSVRPCAGAETDKKETETDETSHHLYRRRLLRQSRARRLGAILLYGAHKKELSGGAPDTTNNRMELTAVIEALSMLKEPCVVELWSDSKYVIDGLSKGWAKGWRARGWVKSDKKPALNPDLWERLLELEECHTLRYHWVKGHAENPYNNRCDELAVAESRKYK